MLNKNCIKTILNVKHTCIDKVTMLADTSIMIEVHATKGEQCRCGICGKKSKFYDNGNEGARTWRACDWAGHKVILVGPSCRVNCKEHGVVTCCFPWTRHGSRFTRKFEEQTAWMAVNCSRLAVAAFMRISWNTVGPIIKRVENDLDTVRVDAWFKWARHCRIPAFVELQKKINRHMQSILNTIEYGLTNARIEAINNKIKLSIRMAYGFRNLDNMMAMIMLRCSDIKVQLPWEKDECVARVSYLLTHSDDASFFFLIGYAMINRS